MTSLSAPAEIGARCLAWAPTPVTDVAYRERADGLYLCDLLSDREIRINQPARYICEQLDGHATLQEVAEMFAQRFGIDLDTAVGDVVEVFGVLKKAKLTVVVGSVRYHYLRAINWTAGIHEEEPCTSNRM